MLLLHTLRGLLEVGVGFATQTHLGVIGMVLLFALGVGIRARHSGLAVGSAVMLALLMTQA